MLLRLVTYNIHKGIGGIDRRYRPERIIETLKHYQPDIVLLQEVDDGVPRSRGDRQVDLFSEAMELPYHAFQRNVRLTKGHYGNAILSRFPLSDVQNIDLTIPMKKKRRALFARCHIKGRTLVLINLHLGLAGFERIMQLRKVLNNKSFKHLHHITPTIVGGDFNDVWGTLNKHCMRPAGFSQVSKHASTFPAFMPVRQLDNMYYRGQMSFLHSFPGRTQVARQASDHLPLVAEFEFFK